MTIFWLRYCTTVSQNVTTGRNWAKCTRDLSVLFFTTACESTIALIKMWIKKKSLYKHCYWYERNKSTLSSVLILIRCTFWVSRIMVFPFSNVLQPWMLCFWVILETQCSITSCSFPKKHGFSSLKRINIKQSLLPVTQNTWHYLQRKYFSHFRFPFRWVFFTKILL